MLRILQGDVEEKGGGSFFFLNGHHSCVSLKTSKNGIFHIIFSKLARGRKPPNPAI